MNLAADAALEHATLLRLAAGGFRDMTRIAAGDPAIWPDVCVENRAGILDVLDRLLAALGDVRELVRGRGPGGDAEACSSGPGRPGSTSRPEPPPSEVTAEVRVPVFDRPGCPRRGHHPARARWASTSTTSRSPTAPKATGACWCWWSTPRPPTGSAPPCTTRRSAARSGRLGP